MAVWLELTREHRAFVVAAPAAQLYCLEKTGLPPPLAALVLPYSAPTPIPVALDAYFAWAGQLVHWVLEADDPAYGRRLLLATGLPCQSGVL